MPPAGLTDFQSLAPAPKPTFSVLLSLLLGKGSHSFPVSTILIKHISYALCATPVHTGSAHAEGHTSLVTL